MAVMKHRNQFEKERRQTKRRYLVRKSRGKVYKKMSSPVTTGKCDGIITVAVEECKIDF